MPVGGGMSSGSVFSFSGKYEGVFGGTYGGGESVSSDFTKTCVTWESFAVIAGVVSLGALVLLFNRDELEQDTKATDEEKQFISRPFALLIVLVFWTLIGLVASLFTSHYYDRAQDKYGNSALVVGADANDYGNSVSPFAWEFTIWSSAVASSMGIDAFVNGVPSTGITALTFTTSLNLVGWAAEHIYVGAPSYLDAQSHLITTDLNPTTRAWEGVALVSGSLAFLLSIWIFLLPKPVVVHDIK